MTRDELRSHGYSLRWSQVRLADGTIYVSICQHGIWFEQLIGTSKEKLREEGYKLAEVDFVRQRLA